MELNDLVGKTVTAVKYEDEWDAGITLTFSDGTTFKVKEEMQAGTIGVYVNGEFAVSEWKAEL
jgi:hypothetical protein